MDGYQGDYEAIEHENKGDGSDNVLVVSPREAWVSKKGVCNGDDA
jgi:hypothetical protein